MTRGTRTLRPMIADLGTVTIAEAVDLAAALWADKKFHPGDPTKMIKVAADIHRWATANDITILAQIEGKVAKTMLRDLSGVKKLKGPHKPKTTKHLRLILNTLIALRGTVLASRTDSPSKRGNRPANDTLAAGLPLIPQDETAQPSGARQPARPLDDDDILLGRLLLEIDLMEAAPVLPMLAYLFAENGISTASSAKLERDHLDHPTAPREVTVQGLWKTPSRQVTFTPYVADTLARILPRLRNGNQSLSYAGEATEVRSPSCTLNPVIKRYLARAGVSGPDVTAKSLTLWRPDHLIRRGQWEQARTVHGMRSANLLNALNYVSDETELYKQQIIIRRSGTNKAIARVPSWEFQAA